MRTIHRILVLLSILIGPTIGLSSCATTGISPRQILKYKQSVVEVGLQLEYKETGTRVMTNGTGFFVTKKHVLTAGHVCKAIDRISTVLQESPDIVSYKTVVKFNGRYLDAYVTVWEFDSSDGSPDACIIELSRPEKRATVVKLRDKLDRDVEYGSVTLVGNGLGLGISVLHGYVVTVRSLQDSFSRDKMIVSMHAAPGHSGSPIFDRHGYVIGMLTYVYRTHSISGGIPSPELSHFLKSYLGE